MRNLHITATITQFDRAAWNACFAGELEDYDHYRAIEHAGINGFEWFYVAVREGETIVAATAGFITSYELDTTLQGFLKKPVAAIKRAFPTFLKLSLSCIGSPVAECGYVGFHPTVDTTMQQTLLAELVIGVEKMAAARGITLTGIKDIANPQRPLWDACMAARGYKRIRSLPTGILDLHGQSFDGYLATLSKATRKDMRRKMKVAAAITVETCHDLGSLTPTLMALYHDTKNRSDWQFEELTAAYFTGVLETMPNRALYFVYYAEGAPVAFNLMFLDQQRMIDKFFCMNADAGRNYNLYFISWLHNINYCITHGIGLYQSGQAGYETKLRLGSALIANWLYFKHRNRMIHAVLRLVAPLLEVKEPSRA